MEGEIVTNPVFNPSGQQVRFFQIDPTSSFLRFDSALEIPADPLIIDLQSLNIDPGDIIVIQGVGAYSAGAGFPEITQEAIIVASESTQLLGGATLDRVPDAVDIDFGFEVMTVFEQANGVDVSNDIPEDAPLPFTEPFFTPDAPFSFVVPAGARYLFVGVADDRLTDNVDSDDDFGLQLTSFDGSTAILGTEFSDSGEGGTPLLTGTADDDVMFGFDGDDRFTSSPGADSIYGGFGFDIVNYGNSSISVIVDLSDDQPEIGGNAEGDILVGVEQVIGTAGNDRFTFAGDFGVFTGAGGGDTITVSGFQNIINGRPIDFLDDQIINANGSTEFDFFGIADQSAFRIVSLREENGDTVVRIADGPQFFEFTLQDRIFTNFSRTDFNDFVKVRFSNETVFNGRDTINTSNQPGDLGGLFVGVSDGQQTVDADLTVTGASTVLEVGTPGSVNDPANVVVGQDNPGGRARLLIENGATVRSVNTFQPTINDTSSGGVIIGNGSVNPGLLSVTGNNSRLLVEGVGPRIAVGINPGAGRTVNSTPSDFAFAPFTIPDSFTGSSDVQGVLAVTDGGYASAIELEVGQTGGDGMVRIEGGTLRLSDALGASSASYSGRGGVANFGRGDSTGLLSITDGGQMIVENTIGQTNSPGVWLSRDAGSSAFAEISGSGSSLEIRQNGTLQDGGFGNGAYLIFGSDGQAILNISNGGTVGVYGYGAALSGAADGRATHQITITSGGQLVIDSVSFGGGYVDLSGAGGTEVLVSGQGSLFAVRSGAFSGTAGESDDFGSFQFGGTGSAGFSLIVEDNARLEARSLELIGSNTDARVASGGTIALTSTFFDPTQGASVDQGASLEVQNGGTLSIRGSDTRADGGRGTGMLEIGATGDGEVSVFQGGVLQGFYADVGAQGSGSLRIAGGLWQHSDAYGTFREVDAGAFPDSPGNLGGATNEGALARFGGASGSSGALSVINGGVAEISVAIGLGAETEAQRREGITGKTAPTVRFAEEIGSLGTLTVNGSDSSLRILQDGTADTGNGFAGPTLALGASGGETAGNGVASGVVGNNGSVLLRGEAASLVIGEDRASAQSDVDPATVESSLVIRGAGTVSVLSEGAAMAPVAAGAFVTIGDQTGASGRLSVDGGGSTLLVRGTIAEGATELATGSRILVGDQGNGALQITNGAIVTVDGGSGRLTGVNIGTGDAAGGTVPTSSVAITGAGAELVITGTRGFEAGRFSGATVSVGDGVGHDASLRISDGGSLRYDGTGAILVFTGDDAGDLGRIEVGSGGTMTLGPNGTLAAGVGINSEAGEGGVSGEGQPTDSFFDRAGGGMGAVTVSPNGRVTAGNVVIGENGSLAFGGTITSDLDLYGDLTIEGEGSLIGAATLEGDLMVGAGAGVTRVFDVDGRGAGQFDSLAVTGVAQFEDGAQDSFIFDVDETSLTSGDRIPFLDAGGVIGFDATAAPVVTGGGLFEYSYDVDASTGVISLVVDEPLQAVNGTPGDDVFTIDNLSTGRRYEGGPGFDTAVFDLPLGFFAQERLPVGFRFRPDEGQSQVLVAVERVQFSDTTIQLSTDALVIDVAFVYELAFNRDPDSGGLGFWVDVAADVSLLELSRIFIASEEFALLVGANPSSGTIVDTFYINGLGRAPDEGGRNYWIGELDSGRVQPEELMLAFVVAPETRELNAERIEEGFYLEV